MFGALDFRCWFWCDFLSILDSKRLPKCTQISSQITLQSEFHQNRKTFKFTVRSLQIKGSEGLKSMFFWYKNHKIWSQQITCILHQFLMQKWPPNHPQIAPKWPPNAPLGTPWSALGAFQTPWSTLEALQGPILEFRRTDFEPPEIDFGDSRLILNPYGQFGFLQEWFLISFDFLDHQCTLKLWSDQNLVSFYRILMISRPFWSQWWDLSSEIILIRNSSK